MPLRTRRPLPLGDDGVGAKAWITVSYCRTSSRRGVLDAAANAQFRVCLVPQIPRDVEVVVALEAERAEQCRRLDVPPSSYAQDLGHLAAQGADLAAAAAAAAAAAEADGDGGGGGGGAAVAPSAVGVRCVVCWRESGFGL